MKSNKRKRGFTLIELLIVVLITGILAAIALPQYQKAVKKVQGREVLLAINTLDTALQAHALEKGQLEAPVYAGNLLVKIPALTHFQYTGYHGFPGSPTATFQNSGYGDGSSNIEIFFQANAGNALVRAFWDRKTGRRTSTRCEGTKCSSYFDCLLVTTGRCYANMSATSKETCPDSNTWVEESYCDLN